MFAPTLISCVVNGNGKSPNAVLPSDVSDLSRFHTLDPLLHLEWNGDRKGMKSVIDSQWNPSC